MPKFRKCRSCNRPVGPDNDLRQLLNLAGFTEDQISEVIPEGFSQHILPDEWYCPGQRSVAQYLEGQIHTSDYYPEFEAVIRKAYHELTSSMLTCNPPDIP